MFALVGASSSAFGGRAGEAEVDWRWGWGRGLVETRGAREVGGGLEGGADVVAQSRVCEDGEALAGVEGGA